MSMALGLLRFIRRKHIEKCISQLGYLSDMDKSEILWQLYATRGEVVGNLRLLFPYEATKRDAIEKLIERERRLDLPPSRRMALVIHGFTTDWLFLGEKPGSSYDQSLKKLWKKVLSEGAMHLPEVAKEWAKVYDNWDSEKKGSIGNNSDLDTWKKNLGYRAGIEVDAFLQEPKRIMPPFLSS